MTGTEKIRNLIFSALVMILAACVCLGYVLYKRDFAKFHIEMSWFNFPIFVGEILLIFCAVALAGKYFTDRASRSEKTLALNRYYLAAGLFLCWLIFKMVFGYWQWGPLAFRHAALFYYSLFFMIGYVFFNRDLFARWSVLLFFSVIVIIFLFRRYDYYWTFTLAALGFILILATEHKKIRIFMLAALLMSVPYIFLFKTSRMMFVANVASFLFVMASVLYLWKSRIFVKLAVLVIFFVVLGAGFYKFFVLGESGRVFVSPAVIFDAFGQMDKDVQQKKDHFQKAPLAVGLYHPPNKKGRSYHYYNRDVENILLHDEEMADLQDDSNVALVRLVSGKEQGAVTKSIISVEGSAVEGSVADGNVVERNVADGSVVDGSVVERNVADRNVVERNVADGNVADGSVIERQAPAVVVEEPVMPLEWTSVNNIVFRLFIWRDILEDWKQQGRPLMGVDFGRPFRSVSLEILDWCVEEWSRDGWIEPHNSFLHMLYRGCVIGLGLVVLIWCSLICFMIESWRRKSWIMILLSAVMINWLVAANFLLILELPYTAIPFWLIAGMSWAYAYRDEVKTGKVLDET